MTKNDFILLFAERLQIANDGLTEDTILKSLDGWDSWTSLELMTMVDESFQVVLTSDDLSEIVTIGDLIKKIGEPKFN